MIDGAGHAQLNLLYYPTSCPYQDVPVGRVSLESHFLPQVIRVIMVIRDIQVEMELTAAQESLVNLEFQDIQASTEVTLFKKG